MRYAQIRAGQRLHLVCEPGEQWPGQEIVRAGSLGQPICGRLTIVGYLMTCNLPLAHACRNCLRVFEAHHKMKGVPRG